MRDGDRGRRIHIGIFGREHIGKTRLLNALARQKVLIVPPNTGTNDDPVEITAEFPPLGPVLLIDTSDIDDIKALERKRIKKTRRVCDRTDIAVIIVEPYKWGGYEELLAKELTARKVPVIIAINKSDITEADVKLTAVPPAYMNKSVRISALTGAGIADLRRTIVTRASPKYLRQTTPGGDIIGAGEIVIFVVPVDKQGATDRINLLRARTIRDFLADDSVCMVVNNRDLSITLASLKVVPKIVVADSEILLKVVAELPEGVPITSSSVMLSHFRKALIRNVEGAMVLQRLREGDRVLIADACARHPAGHTAGRKETPDWLKQYVGGSIRFDYCYGHHFPENISAYDLVINCESCSLNGSELASRLICCTDIGTPVTNYGLAMAFSQGMLERILEPFPKALEVCRLLRSSAATI
jgi:[FeFe] hydrogenase H-cluster maturation GTPase HydF